MKSLFKDILYVYKQKTEKLLTSSTLNNYIDPVFIISSLSNLLFIISIKLNSSNYPVWKAQTLPYFRGHDVFGYIDSTIPISPQEIDALHPSTCARIKILDPHYIQWLYQDSLILATINASLTEDVLTQIMSYTISHEVWLTLERSFSSISHAKDYLNLHSTSKCLERCFIC